MYGTVTGFTDYATARGYDLSAVDDSAKAEALVRATQYVDGLGYRENAAGVRASYWPGVPADANQDYEWPRTGASDIYGNDLDATSVPSRVERATYEAAFFSASGGELNRSQSSGQIVKREKIDVIEIEYDTSSVSAENTDSRINIPAVDDLLAPILGAGGSSTSYGIGILAV